MNYNSLLVMAAMLAFGLGILGIAFAINRSSQGRSARRWVALAALGLLAGTGINLFNACLLVVQPGWAAVVVDVNSGVLREPPLAPGIALITPVLQEAILYPTHERVYSMSDASADGSAQGSDGLEALTRDRQKVTLHVTVTYHIEILDVNEIHLRWQDRYEAGFIRPSVRAVARDVVSKYKADAIYGEKREALGTAIEDKARARMDAEGLTLTELRIDDIVFLD